MESAQKNTNLIIGLIVVAAIFFVGLVWLLFRLPSEQVSKGPRDEQVSFDDAQDLSIGPVDASIVVHLYSDLQCPACRAAEGGVKPTIERYKDRVKFVWKDFPLLSHKYAKDAALAARCAAKQDKFWMYHDTLYEKQDEWSAVTSPKESFRQYAKDLGLNVSIFDQCVVERQEMQKVENNISEGLRNRVDRTPTFFLNRRRYFGMSPSVWQIRLDELLTATTTTP